MTEIGWKSKAVARGYAGRTAVVPTEAGNIGGADVTCVHANEIAATLGPVE